MGLFGYNKKKFYKNTEVFKGELAEIVKSVAGDRKTCGMLEAAIQSLDLSLYPKKADPKELEAIDARILTLIGKVRECIASQRQASAPGYAALLLSAVADSRTCGKERYTPEELQFLEEIARLPGFIGELVSRCEAIEKRRRDLVEQCYNLDKTSEKYQNNLCEWRQLGVETEQLDKEIGELRKRYYQLEKEYDRHRGDYPPFGE